MPYIEGRVVHDVDSHIMEPPGYAEEYADPNVRERLAAVLETGRPPSHIDAALERQRDPAFRALDAQEIMIRKNHLAVGAMLREDRPTALNHLGFASQLVFTTTYLAPLRRLDLGGEIELAYALATAHNRGMVDFCSLDARLLPVCYVPFADIDRAAAAAAEAIELGAAALMIASQPPRRHSPSHVGFDAVWSIAEAAGRPIIFHVGGEVPMDPVYKQNGLAPVPDFHGGDTNFTSVSYMAIPYAPMQTLATLIFDGVLDRFPDLRFGVIELGASWVPGWMCAMDSAARRVQQERGSAPPPASCTPSEFVRRQVRVTPYPHEPAGWILEQTGPEVTMFSSDYPHVEGGRNPMKRFESSLDGCSDEDRHAFFEGNFVDLMGDALSGVPVAA